MKIHSPKTTKYRILWTIVLVLVPFLNGCEGGISPRTIAAHKIADALPGILGPAAHYEAQVDGNIFALSRGHAKHVHIEGQEVQVAPGTVLDTLTIDAFDISFDTSTQRVERIGRTDFAATIGQQSLDRYLAAGKSQISGLTVTLGSSNLQAIIPMTVKSAQTTVALTGLVRPSTQGLNKVDFKATGTKVGWMPVPVFLTNLALRRVNPIVDLSTLRIPIALTQTTIVNKTLFLHGSAQIDPTRLNTASTPSARR